MSNLKKSFQGIFPILSTPTDKNGNIVFEDLRKQVEWMINNGVNGVGIAIASEINKTENLLDNQLEKIGGRLTAVFEESKKSGESPDSVARRIAWERINS